jgi:hypothetical protein
MDARRGQRRGRQIVRKIPKSTRPTTRYASGSATTATAIA